MRCDVSRALNVVDLEQASNRSCRFLLQQRIREANRGLVAKNGNRLRAVADLERRSRPEDIALIADANAPDPLAARPVAVRITEDAGTALSRIPFDRCKRTSHERRIHGNLHLLAGHPVDALERGAFERDQSEVLRHGVGTRDARRFHQQEPQCFAQPPGERSVGRLHGAHRVTTVNSLPRPSSHW